MNICRKKRGARVVRTQGGGRACQAENVSKEKDLKAVGEKSCRSSIWLKYNVQRDCWKLRLKR